ncbi:hypothetical protein GCM10011506_30360 [Marivirga lumbricoides]|uniref:Methyltransferase FkbM domain-containing protein n=1 Tax=Marivirga lumbricoides TaxID=1046115 RepID=A0ABQ1MTI2_9BACT|nr:hypothetical protein GCM10011506_30360 [Marivirga lumbricoides]
MKTYSNKYRILNKIYQLGLLESINFSISTSINKRKFKIPIQAGLGLSHLVNEEPWMTHFLLEFREFFKKKYFLDIGVNIGQTLLKLKSIYPDSKYIGFEPNPHCLSYLSNLTHSNSISNTTILPVAASDKTSLIELLFDNDSLTDSAAGISKFYRKGTKRKINILELDPHLILNLKEKEIGLIKIDVEGSELEVLKGLKQIIENNKPIIFIEILPVYSEENNERLDRQNEIQKLINAFNYEVFRIDEKNLELHLLRAFDVHGDLSLCNYILKPKK